MIKLGIDAPARLFPCIGRRFTTRFRTTTAKPLNKERPNPAPFRHILRRPNSRRRDSSCSVRAPSNQKPAYNHKEIDYGHQHQHVAENRGHQPATSQSMLAKSCPAQLRLQAHQPA